MQGSEDKLDVCQPWNEYFKIYNYIVSYIVKALLTFCLQEAIWDKKKDPDVLTIENLEKFHVMGLQIWTIDSGKSGGKYFDTC